MLSSLMFKTADRQYMRLLKHWFETIQRLLEVHLKWNFSLNRGLNVELSFRD